MALTIEIPGRAFRNTTLNTRRKWLRLTLYCPEYEVITIGIHYKNGGRGDILEGTTNP